MTANQLALASLREATRHNMAGEEETTRHNTETESISKEQNRLNELATTLTDERERQKIQYQKDYNDAYISYLNASEAEKEWYEWQMTNLKEAELNYEKKYKEDMSRIQDELAYWQGENVKNDAKYKEAWKEVQLLNADLENKRIQYEMAAKREQIESNEKIQHEINALTQWRDTSNYVLNMEKTAQQWSDLRNQQTALELKVEQQGEFIKNLKADTAAKKSTAFKNYWTSIFDSINSTVENGFRIFDKYLGGTKYGKAKAAAEALFKD